MFGFLGKVKDYVASNVENVSTKLKKEVNEFLEENRKLEANAKAEDQRRDEAKLPWENLKIINNSNGNIRNIIRDEILDLSNHEENFLTEESNYMFEFDFNMDECKYQAIKLMGYDARLGLLRNQLVPAKTSDEKFWKNYFYNVELIKMKHAIKAEEEAALCHEIRIEDGDDVLKSDENDEEAESNLKHADKLTRGTNETEDTQNTTTSEKAKTFEIGGENESTSPTMEINLQETK